MREQYFHAWRSFHYDENTDTIDSYIYKVKQVATLLNYGEPQILELFKNTLPSRLYYKLYQIDDLRMAVETAKRLLTKEQIDKKSGQATTSPFMKTSQENSKSKSKNEKKVSFSAVEAMESTTDGIERLASLMDKMDTKLDRRDNQYRPRIYQGGNRGHGYRQNNYRSRNRSYSRDRYQNNYRGTGNYSSIEVIETIGPITEIVVGLERETTIEMGTGTTIDQTTEGTIVTKGIETGV